MEISAPQYKALINWWMLQVRVLCETTEQLPGSFDYLGSLFDAQEEEEVSALPLSFQILSVFLCLNALLFTSKTDHVTTF